MINPNKADLGRRVVYANHRLPQHGVITDLTYASTQYVLVRFNGDIISTLTWTGKLDWEEQKNL